MNDWCLWQTFITSGNVFDYLRYKSIQNAKNTGADTINREETDEIPDRRTDYKGTEYR